MIKSDVEAVTSSWGQIFLIYALCVLGAATISQAVPVIGDIARLYHPSRQITGYIISLPSAMVAFGALLSGWVVDRVGDKRVLLAGCATIILGDLGVAFSSSLDQLLIMRAVEGLGYVCVAVSTVTMVTRTTQGARRTSALTLWSSFVPMSFALPLLLARQLAGTGQWRWAFLGHAIAVAALALAAVALLPAWSPSGSPLRTGGLRAVLSKPAVYLLGLAFAAAAFLQTGIVSTLPGQLGARYGISIGLAGAIVTLGMIVNTAGSLATGQLLNRGMGGLSVAAAGVALALAAALGMFLTTPSFAVTAALSLVFFLGSGLVVGLWALMPLVAPSPKAIGATSGLVTQITLWGVLFGPPAAFAALAGGGGGGRMAVNTVAAMSICIGALALALYGRASAKASPSIQSPATPIS
jgi:predicted MFS family arabinose efflux permease